MTKTELLNEFDNAMTVGQLIKKLQKYDANLPVINDCRNRLPIGNVEKTSVDYCYDEIITKKVVSIW